MQAGLDGFPRARSDGNLDGTQFLHDTHDQVDVGRARLVVGGPAIQVLVSQDVPTDFVEFPQQLRGDAPDERGGSGFTGLTDHHSVIGRQSFDEYHSVSGFERGRERRVLAGGDGSPGEDGSGACADRIDQCGVQVFPSDAFRHGLS